MTKRIVSLLFSVIFLGLCAVPMIGLLLTGGAEAGANEVLAPAPVFFERDGSFNADVFADLSSYIGGRFFLRQECVTAWARLNSSLLRTSVTEDVILGSDGWLYFAPTLADYTRSAPMSGRELWCAARTLYLVQEQAESRGARFLFTIAPNKNSLYNDAMPVYPVSDGPSNAEAMRELLSSMGVHYLDLFPVFAAEDEVLYFPTDSHWNGKGAALAADAILAALGRENGYYSGPFAAGAHRGDLYEMLYPAGKSEDPDFVYAPGFTFTANTANPDNARIRTEGPGTGGLLMYRDSFGRNLYPYLAESFESAEFSRKNSFDPSLLPEGGAMVIELVERNLRYLIEYDPVLSAPERDPSAARDAASRGELAVTAAAGSGGLVTLSGVFEDVRPDDDSPVYVAAEGALYEAVPRPAGFAASVPEAAAKGELQIVFTSAGELVSLRCVTQQ